MEKKEPSWDSVSPEVLTVREVLRHISTKEDPRDQLTDLHFIAVLVQQMKDDITPLVLQVLREAEQKARPRQDAHRKEFVAVKGPIRFRVSLNDKNNVFYKDKELLSLLRTMYAKRKELRQQYLGRAGHQPAEIDPDGFTVDVEVR